MGKVIGIDRGLARTIKRMNRKELDGYLARVTDRSFHNGYEDGLKDGVALARKALEEELVEKRRKKEMTTEEAMEIAKAVDRRMIGKTENLRDEEIEKIKGIAADTEKPEKEEENRGCE